MLGKYSCQLEGAIQLFIQGNSTLPSPVDIAAHVWSIWRLVSGVFVQVMTIYQNYPDTNLNQHTHCQEPLLARILGVRLQFG